MGLLISTSKEHSLVSAQYRSVQAIDLGNVCLSVTKRTVQSVKLSVSGLNLRQKLNTIDLVIPLKLLNFDSENY